ncbi:PQQ-dependent sugar dehydrogenase [Archangium sp.]|uniref:PQQ-dependent sugar dehydrogenase n=1 Tax=Archangium sp. TaxID=1872627 RepID=UPI002D5E5E15|nr:PQQ-dependent sugar dehydrogenase [Archangium sp.]HYO55548.1 PQQ-dependent sugar dehydrogenase [Archangium sp.]
MPSARSSRGFTRRAKYLFLWLGWAMLASAHARGSDLEANPPRRTVQNSALPSGFSDEVFISGLEVPTNFVSLPDGRFFIAEKSGVVRVYEQGALLPTPLLDIRDQVNDYQDRGLMGLAVDPEFPANGFIYLLYTYDDDTLDDLEPKVGRLARYTVVGNTASPASEVILLGTHVGTSCNDLPTGADCIPSDSPSHSIGHLEFAPDGTLFVTLGDAAHYDYVDDNALRAQDLDSLSGKLLRITRSGEGLPTNPFWTGEARANRSKVFSYGLRNPYRFHLRPGTSTPYLGDVGWNQYEEINVATAGANFGWPCYEGPERQGGYEPKAVCQALYAQGPSAVKMPLYFWDHSAGGACATGGFFYTGTDYPSSYWGAYFFGDYAQGWFRSLRVDADDNLIPDSVTLFESGTISSVGIGPGPGGDIYYVSISEGQVRRIRYTVGNTPPTVVASATPPNGYAPLHVRFSSAGTGDPDGDLLDYSWDFGDGTGSSLAHPEHSYTANGDYTAQLTVSDRRGGIRSTRLNIIVGDSAPTVTITSPAQGTSFRVGDVITYSGEALDVEEGRIPADRLSWTITLHHCTLGTCHAHPYTSHTGASGTLVIPDHGDEFYFDLTLSASDSRGLTGTRTVPVHPRTVQLTLETFPSGLQVVLDGQSGTAPLTRTVVAGSRNTVYAPSPQEPYEFQGWSDGGAQEHEVEAGESSATYTATFAQPMPAECPEGQYRAEYYNNTTLDGAPVMVRCESAPIQYDWGEGSPALEVAADDFSVRWTGQFRLSFGLYRFTARADDGVRVYVNGAQIIDEWRDQAPTTYTGSIFLLGGHYQVVMEYYEHSGGAVSQLNWRRL